MRRYTLNISDKEFVLDVQELAADRFEDVVGGETYEVSLGSDESLAEAVITPAFDPGAHAPRAASSAASVQRAAPKVAAAPAASAPKAAPAARPAAGGGKGALTAPMPGTILEVNVKPGDTLARGQQVAILDAMKMHNVIGAPRAGTVAEVYVTAGQAVNHGDAIIKFKED